MIKATLAAVGGLIALITILSFVRSRAWWVRIFDFPRAQIAVASVLLLSGWGLTNVGDVEARRWEWFAFVVVGAAAAVQASQMLPYTRAWKRQVGAAPPRADERDRIRIVISNVCMKNRDSDRWLKTLLHERPHVIVAVEVDEWWTDRLRRALSRDFPHRLEQPQGNTYGMAIYSRLPLHDARIEHLVEPEVPSAFVTIELGSGQRMKCVVLHPRPPRPDIQQGSDWRDAELVRAARRVESERGPVVVAGDLNDVAWSHTTHLFQRISRLLDPRIGRGLFATYHADHRVLRYPLDHVFISNHFALAALRRLAHVGSDHFPIFVELVLVEQKPPPPDVEPMDEDDHAQAAEAVQDVKRLRETETPEERRARTHGDR